MSAERTGVQAGSLSAVDGVADPVPPAASSFAKAAADQPKPPAIVAPSSATSVEPLDQLAALLEYPGADYPARLETCRQALERAQPSAADRMARLGRQLASRSPGEVEELFIRTFELAPRCVPYVGVHLFGGENFKRGEFMARLQAEFAQMGLETGGELPDHLAVLLRYAARTDRGTAGELVQYCLMTPVDRMIGALDAANPFVSLLEAVAFAMAEIFPECSPAPLPVETKPTGAAASP